MGTNCFEIDTWLDCQNSIGTKIDNLLILDSRSLIGSNVDQWERVISLWVILPELKNIRWCLKTENSIFPKIQFCFQIGNFWSDQNFFIQIDFQSSCLDRKRCWYPRQKPQSALHLKFYFKIEFQKCCMKKLLIEKCCMRVAREESLIIEAQQVLYVRAK